MNTSYDFGMIGLGTMGRNFLLNVADHGYSAFGLDLDAEKVEALNRESEDRPVSGTTKVEEFVAHLKTPRRIMLLVPAGKAVDAVINELVPLLSAGDLIIDGGNSHFDDTNRRMQELAARNIRFLGVGVSGGSDGARRGPSIMPGGARDAYELVRPLLEAVAAKVDGEPCVAYMGERSAGHYVKMVHNGIEYGLMQLIAEAYDLLRNAGGATNDEIQAVFAEWNQGPLRSFLIEITADIFRRRDPATGEFLVDLILDKAKQKGTGKWTSQTALDLGIPVPTIDAAVHMRGISSFKQIRTEAAVALPVEGNSPRPGKEFVEHLRSALHFAFIVTYAQGIHLLAEASRDFSYGLQLPEIAKIWRGGCIIRADLLETIRQALTEEPKTLNLIFTRRFQGDLIHALPSVRTVLQTGLQRGIPLLALSSTLQYFQAFHTANLPLNLVQAQRDYFGAHTYERIDRDGVFHTEWGQG